MSEDQAKDEVAGVTGNQESASEKPASERPASERPTRTGAVSNLGTSLAAMQPSRKRLLFAGIGALGAVLVGLVLLLFMGGSDEGVIADRTHVAGVDIGKLTRDQAIARLNEQLAPRAKAPLALTAGGRTQDVNPVEAGLAFDVNATVDHALQSPGVLDRFGTREIDPVITTNQEKLKAVTTKVAKSFESKLQEGDIIFKDAKAVLKTPRAGITVKPADVGNVMKSYLLQPRPDKAIEVSNDRKDPKISSEELEKVFNEVAQPAVSGPVTIADVPPRQVVLQPADFSVELGFEPSDSGKLEMTVDGEAIADLVNRKMGTTGVEPLNATFTVTGGMPQIVEGRPGRAIDAANLAETMKIVLARTNDRTVQIMRIDAQPTVTGDDLRKLGIKEQVSTFTQRFAPAPYRTQNIGQAAKYLNGTLVKPGETFSLNKTIKKRTEANGYTSGYIISNGRFTKEMGGGVSTIATTVWTNAFLAGMERVEQRAHSLFIDRYRAGLEATVDWDSLDLKFKNTTPTGVFITSSATSSNVTVTFWGTKQYTIEAIDGPRRNTRPYKTVYEDNKIVDGKPTCEPQNGVDGFDITVTRVFRALDNGQEVKREDFTTKYDATNQVICGPAPATPTTPTLSPTPSTSASPSASDKPGRQRR